MARRKKHRLHRRDEVSLGHDSKKELNLISDEEIARFFSDYPLAIKKLVDDCYITQALIRRLVKEGKIKPEMKIIDLISVITGKIRENIKVTKIKIDNVSSLN